MFAKKKSYILRAKKYFTAHNFGKSVRVQEQISAFNTDFFLLNQIHILIR